MPSLNQDINAFEKPEPFNLYDEDTFTLINQNYLYNTYHVPGSSLSTLYVKVIFCVHFMCKSDS